MSTKKLADVLADLHLLTIIAENKSLTRAANRLDLSKASVSERLRSLERAVGMPLVRRTPRGVALTAEAIQLVQDTRLAFARIEESFQLIQDVAGSPRGLIRVSCPVAFGRQCIAPLMPAFLHQYPDIRVELDLSDRLVNLAEDGFDVAIRHANTVPDRYIAKLLAPSQALLVASPDYLSRHGTPRTPADLVSHSCLLYLRDLASQTWSFERLSEGRQSLREIVPVSGAFRANNSEVLREAILGGLGIGLLPDFSVTGDVYEKGLRVVLPDWRPVGFFGERIVAVREGRGRAPRAVECLVEFLRRHVGRQREKVSRTRSLRS